MTEIFQSRVTARIEANDFDWIKDELRSDDYVVYDPAMAGVPIAVEIVRTATQLGNIEVVKFMIANYPPIVDMYRELIESYAPTADTVDMLVLLVAAYGTDELNIDQILWHMTYEHRFSVKPSINYDNLYSKYDFIFSTFGFDNHSASLHFYMRLGNFNPKIVDLFYAHGLSTTELTHADSIINFLRCDEKETLAHGIAKSEILKHIPSSILKLLVSGREFHKFMRSPDYEDYFNSDSWLEDYGIIMTLIDNGMDINAMDGRLLEYAVVRKNRLAVENLMACGAFSTPEIDKSALGEMKTVLETRKKRRMQLIETLAAFHEEEVKDDDDDDDE